MARSAPKKEGYVYILTNPGYPKDMLKIGATTRTPEQRTWELYKEQTGVPDKFSVAYQRRIPNCFLAEEIAHNRLARFRTNKYREFFKLSLERAKVLVDQVADEVIELYKPKKVKEISEKEEKAAENKRQFEEWKNNINTQLVEVEREIINRYEGILRSRFPETPLWQYWVGLSIAAVVGIAIFATNISAIFATNISDSTMLLLSVIVGGIASPFVRKFFKNRRMKSKDYLREIEKRKNELESVLVELPSNIIEEKLSRIPDNVLGNITGKAALRREQQNLKYAGEIENNDKEWTITALTARIRNKNTNEYRDYEIPVFLPPFKRWRFIIAVDDIPEDRTWSIVDVKGYQRTPQAQISGGGNSESATETTTKNGKSGATSKEVHNAPSKGIEVKEATLEELTRAGGKIPKGITIGGFADSSGIQPSRLLAQLKKAGIVGKKAEDLLSDADKRTLLKYLHGQRGQISPELATAIGVPAMGAAVGGLVGQEEGAVTGAVLGVAALAGAKGIRAATRGVSKVLQNTRIGKALQDTRIRKR